MGKKEHVSGTPPSHKPYKLVVVPPVTSTPPNSLPSLHPALRPTGILYWTCTVSGHSGDTVRDGRLSVNRSPSHRPRHEEGRLLSGHGRVARDTDWCPSRRGVSVRGTLSVARRHNHMSLGSPTLSTCVSTSGSNSSTSSSPSSSRTTTWLWRGGRSRPGCHSSGGSVFRWVTSSSSSSSLVPDPPPPPPPSPLPFHCFSLLLPPGSTGKETTYFLTCYSKSCRS